MVLASDRFVDMSAIAAAIMNLTGGDSIVACKQAKSDRRTKIVRKSRVGSSQPRAEGWSVFQGGFPRIFFAGSFNGDLKLENSPFLSVFDVHIDK
jgi:hypothetical protein